MLFCFVFFSRPFLKENKKKDYGCIKAGWLWWARNNDEPSWVCFYILLPLWCRLAKVKYVQPLAWEKIDCFVALGKKKKKSSRRRWQLDGVGMVPQKQHLKQVKRKPLCVSNFNSQKKPTWFQVCQEAELKFVRSKCETQTHVEQEIEVRWEGLSKHKGSESPWRTCCERRQRLLLAVWKDGKSWAAVSKIDKLKVIHFFSIIEIKIRYNKLLVQWSSRATM